MKKAQQARRQGRRSVATRSAARSPPPTRPGTSTASRAPRASRARLHRRRLGPEATSPRSRASGSPTCRRARRGSPSAASPPPTRACSTSSARPPRTRARRVGELQSWALLPDNLKPPVTATNQGAYGYALDTETSPPALAAAQAHLGHLAASGDPRAWDDAGELTPVDRFAKMFSGTGVLGHDGTPGITRCGSRSTPARSGPATRTPRRRSSASRRPTAPTSARRADLRLRRGPRWAAGARRGEGARAAVGDPAREAGLVQPPVDLRAQRPELGLPGERVRRPACLPSWARSPSTNCATPRRRCAGSAGPARATGKPDATADSPTAHVPGTPASARLADRTADPLSTATRRVSRATWVGFWAGLWPRARRLAPRGGRAQLVAEADQVGVGERRHDRRVGDPGPAELPGVGGGRRPRSPARRAPVHDDRSARTVSARRCGERVAVDRREPGSEAAAPGRRRRTPPSTVSASDSASSPPISKHMPRIIDAHSSGS